MEVAKISETMLQEKYEALLSGLIPEDLKEPLLNDKLSLLQKQNTVLENTILTLRHELSNLIAKQDANIQIPEERAAKYSLVSAAMLKCLNISEFEVSQFSEMHSRALEALNKTSEGFSSLVNTMKSKLFPTNRKILDFMSTVLDQMHEIRAQLGSIHNYITILEYNEKALRDSLSFQESKQCKARSLSARKTDQFEQPERCIGKRYTRTLVLEAPSTKNSMEFKPDEIQAKVNTLKIALGKSKNQRDQLEIENQKLLLQLKQAKEQLALCEENYAAKEVANENKIKKLSSIIAKIREIPNLSEIVVRCEREVNRSANLHRRARSTFHNGEEKFRSIKS